MAPPDAGESGTAPEQPENPWRLRAVEPAEAEPAPRSPERPPHNLPSELSSFVGREEELTEVKRLLENNRLLTLTGSGGCGKTRLASAAASEVVERFEDGVWMVELASLAESSLVPQAVAFTLGVRERPGSSLTEALSAYLRTRKLLLLLDNCEHLIDACAELAGALLHSCPGLRVLATSREVLGITGEIAWPVPSLSLPGLRRLPEIESLPRYESARLFVERTAAVKPNFKLTEQNAPAVAQVCYRLDGIPLALELAAARTKVLSVEEISARLGDSFRLLAAGSRTAMPRQRTLHATMDWSHELLSQKERVLFRRLSVFAGGFTLEAAESICAGEDERARNLLEEGLKLSAELGNEADVAHCLEGLASIVAAEGSIVRAARLWGAEETLLEKLEDAVYTYVPDRALHRSQVAARSELDEAAWTAAWTEGRAMSLEQAVEYTLEQEPAPEPAAPEPYLAGLSAREADVLRLVATGLTNAEVAEKLFLSSRTVDWHLSSIYRKLGLHSRTEASRFASEHGLL